MKYFEVVTVTEGGADFCEYQSITELVERFYKIEDRENAIGWISKMTIGTKFDIDGCSCGYVLRK